MKRMLTLLFAPGQLALAVALGLLLTTTAAQASYSSGNLIQRLQSDGRFKTLLVALEVAGLKDTVATGGTFTILAPTDAAFAALSAGTVESLVTNVPALQNILLYHAISGNESLVQLVREGALRKSPSNWTC